MTVILQTKDRLVKMYWDETAALQKLKDACQSKKMENATLATMEIKKKER